MRKDLEPLEEAFKGIDAVMEAARAMAAFVSFQTHLGYEDYIENLSEGKMTMGEFLDKMDQAMRFGDYNGIHDFIPMSTEEEYIELRYDFCDAAELKF